MRPGERVAVFGLGGTGLSAVLGAVAAGAGEVIAVDARERAAGAGASWARATVEAQGDPEQIAAAVVEASGGGVDYAFETRPAGRGARRLPLHPGAGAAVLLGIPRADAEIGLPALSIPRMERRVLGSIYGSARPDRDFPLILEAYRRGRLPLDRLISHRLPLESVGEAVDQVRTGEATRVVLDLGGG